MATPEAPQGPATPPPVDRTRVWLAVGALAATLIAGLLPQGPSTGLFLLGVAASFLLVRWAFPAMWLYGVWLAAIYALAFLGAVVFALTASVSSPLVGPVPLFAALVLLLELLSLYIALALFAEVKSIRDFRTRLSIARGDSPPEYARIGLWTLALVGFFVLANVSALFFVAWSRGAPTLPAHAALEGLLIGLGVYIIFVPEAAFGELPAEYKQAVKQPEREPSLVRLIAARARARAQGAGREGAPADRCPVCEGPLEFENRKCPSCAAATRVGWCPKSEVHVVACEHCGRGVVYGKPVCPHCKGELKESVACRTCNVHTPLRDWRAASG